MTVHAVSQRCLVWLHACVHLVFVLSVAGCWLPMAIAPQRVTLHHTHM